MNGHSDHVEHIRERLDCREVAEGYGLHFKKRGGDWWVTKCINGEAHAHGDRNPSLSIGPKGFRCFSVNCAISGDVFDLIARLENLGEARDHFQQVLEIAADLAGVDLAMLKQQESSFAPRVNNRRADADMRVRSKSLREAKARVRATAAARSKRVRMGEHEQPLYASHFPNPHTRPFELPHDSPRLSVMRGIWERVESVPLGEPARAWLGSRGIDPEVAYAYGCRDWCEAREDVAEFLAKVDEEALIAAGLSRPDGDELKRWAGLRALDGEAWAQGLAVPMVHPGWLEAPLAWRWRLYEPIETRRGGKLKAMAQYGGEPHVPLFPLGAAPMGAGALAGVARWPELSEDPSDPRYAVVVCEGEPDWLSVADCAAKMETGLYVVPVGLVAMSQGYPQEFSGLLEGAERVVCVMDRGNTSKKREGDARTGGQLVADDIFGLLLYAAQREGLGFDAAFERTKSKVRVRLQADDHDVNDLHMRGSLADLVRDALEGVL